MVRSAASSRLLRVADAHATDFGARAERVLRARLQRILSGAENLATGRLRADGGRSFLTGSGGWLFLRVPAMQLVGNAIRDGIGLLLGRLSGL